ncbi:hypothetical protein GALLN_00542 [Gallionellaceae bacterium]|nr:hypothetical protein GALLN_00542 [Gallionellaceae bacterium]
MPGGPAGVSMDQRQKSSERGAPQREVSAYLSYGFSKNWNLLLWIAASLKEHGNFGEP